MNAILILKKYSSDKKSFNNILLHSMQVRDIALDIAKKAKVRLDLQLISDGAILHDIGRFECTQGKNSAFHGITGGKIMEKEGLVKIKRICETHIGAGITKEEAILAGLPPNDFLPESFEEKIVCYADKLAGNNQDIEKNYEFELDLLKLRHGEKAFLRLKKLRKEIEKMSI
jgi:uncharacterized protein